jgi:LysM repeat protein
VVDRLARLAQGSLRVRGNGKLARFAAPAVFLLAVTAVVLVVRSALQSDTTPARPGGASVTTQARPATRNTGAPSKPKRYYVIHGGDTLGGIAARFSTTVDALLRLNPGVEPTALIPGEQVRVK